MRDAGKILLVEDDPLVRAYLLRGLTLLAREVEVAEDGVDALARWEAGGVGVVLTDHSMPRMDGLTLVRTLRARGFAGQVWVLSGGMSPDLAAAYRALAVEAVLLKPISLEDLRAYFGKTPPLAETRR